MSSAINFKLPKANVVKNAHVATAAVVAKSSVSNKPLSFRKGPNFVVKARPGVKH